MGIVFIFIITTAVTNALCTEESCKNCFFFVEEYIKGSMQTEPLLKENCDIPMKVAHCCSRYFESEIVVEPAQKPHAPREDNNLNYTMIAFGLYLSFVGILIARSARQRFEMSHVRSMIYSTNTCTHPAVDV